MRLWKWNLKLDYKGHNYHCLSLCGQYGDDHGTFTISDSHNRKIEKSEGIIVPMSQRRGSEVMRVLSRAIWLVSGSVETQTCPCPLPRFPHWSPL